MDKQLSTRKDHVEDTRETSKAVKNPSVSALYIPIQILLFFTIRKKQLNEVETLC